MATEHNAQARAGPAVGIVTEVANTRKPVRRFLARAAVGAPGDQLPAIHLFDAFLQLEDKRQLTASLVVKWQVATKRQVLLRKVRLQLQGLMPGVLHPCQDLLQDWQTAALRLPIQQSTINKRGLMAICLSVAGKRAPLPDDKQRWWLILPFGDTQYPGRVV